MEPELPEIIGLEKPSAPGLHARGVMEVQMDVLADSDTGKLHLLSRDAINGLKDNAQSDEAEMFATWLGVLLTASPILISLHLAVYNGTVVVGKFIQAVLIGLWSAVLVSGGLAWYFRKKRNALKKKQDDKFKKILEEGKTVMVLNQSD